MTPEQSREDPDKIEVQKARALNYFKVNSLSHEVLLFWTLHSDFSVSIADQIASQFSRDDINAGRANIAGGTSHEKVVRHLQTLAGPVFEYLAYSHLKANMHKSGNTDFIEIGSKFSEIRDILTETGGVASGPLKRVPYFIGDSIRSKRGGIAIPDGLIIKRNPDLGQITVTGIFESSFRSQRRNIRGHQLFVDLLRQEQPSLEILGASVLNSYDVSIRSPRWFKFVLMVRADFGVAAQNASGEIGWEVQRTPFKYDDVLRITALILKDSLESGIFTMEDATHLHALQ